jgi:hypothetical protein
MSGTPTATIDYQHPIEDIKDPKYSQYLEKMGQQSDAGRNVLATVESGGKAYPILNDSGEMIGIYATDSAFGLDIPGLTHTAAVVQGPNGYANSMIGWRGGNFLGLTGFCHQQVNQALANAGYSLTVNGLSAGWFSYVTGAIYGPYGSAEPALSYFEEEKNRH